jgi:type II secretory pathway component PulF
MALLSPTLSIKNMALWCQQLAWNADSGIPLQRSLDLLAQEGASYEVRRLAARLASNVQRGATFAQAAAWEGRRLPEFFTTMVQAGERTGRLSEVFQGLATYYEELLLLRRALVRQVTYPLMVVFAIILGIPMMTTIVLAEDASRLPLELARLTVHALVPFVAAAFAWAVLNRLLPVGRYAVRGLSHLWPASRLMRRLAVGKFAWAMNLLSAVGLPLPQALVLAAKVSGLPGFERHLLRSAQRVKEGASLSEALAGCRYLNPSHRGYIEVGEQSGRLPQAFGFIARDQFETCVQAMRVCIVTLGGVLIILLGVYIALGAV